MKLTAAHDEYGTGLNLLHFATLGGHFDTARLLQGHIKYDFNVPSSRGYTPLHLVALGTYLEEALRGSATLLLDLPFRHSSDPHFPPSQLI